MRRRDILKSGVAGSLAAVLTSSCMHRPGNAARDWGIGLYTVRREMELDPVKTIADLARMGYSKVEFFRIGYFGIAPAEWRKILGDFGMSAPSRLIRLNHLKEDFGRTLDQAEAIGHTHLVLSYIHQSDRQSMDQYRVLFDLFAKSGEAIRERGLTFGYHHHRFEFDPMDGEIPFDRMLAEVPPELMALTIDTYHVARAGYDPVDFITQNAARVNQLHLKDIGADGDTMFAPGHGVIDFPEALSAFGMSPTRHAYVEHDGATGGTEVSARAIRYLDRIALEGKLQ